MAGTIGTNASRRFIDKMVENGNVMGSQIPKNVNVALNESQIDADGIEIVQIPQITTLHDLTHFPDCTGIYERVVHHEPKTVICSDLDEAFGLSHRSGYGFLHQYMFAVLKGLTSELVMRPDGSRDSNSIY